MQPSRSLYPLSDAHNLPLLRVALCILILAFPGCVSLSNDLVLAHPGAPHGELIIRRESAFTAGAVGMYVGVGDEYFMKLSSGQTGRATVDAGEYQLQAKAIASPASTLRVVVPPHQTVCLAGRVNPKLAAIALTPLVANVVSTFLLFEEKCNGQAQQM